MGQPDKKTDKPAEKAKKTPEDLDANAETPVSEDDAWMDGSEDADDPDLDDSFLDEDDSFLSELGNSGLVGDGGLDDDDLNLDEDTDDVEAQTPSAAAKEIEELKAQLAAAEAKNEKLQAKNDQFALQINDAERAKERLQEQFQKNAKRPLEDAVKKLLEPIDNLERAINAIDDEECANNETLKNTKDGLTMVLDQITQTLASVGIEKVETSDTKFNPDLHEAVSVGQDKDKDNGAILQVCQSGYKSETRLLRPARVIVNKL